MELRRQLIRDIEMLPEEYIHVVSILVKEFTNLSPVAMDDEDEKRRAMFGCLRGKYKMSDDFDAPLDDFKEYME
ncbi:MAG: DUF2281 domain-containing protein [Oscillospiraceae bacterium]|nr:DUF2281 domain-containing protein [Oscillospiraceae bacterium]